MKTKSLRGKLPVSTRNNWISKNASRMSILLRSQILSLCIQSKRDSVSKRLLKIRWTIFPVFDQHWCVIFSVFSDASQKWKPFLYQTEKPYWLPKTRAALIEKLPASGAFASGFQSGVPAERRRRQLPIGSAWLRWGDGWACLAPSPCRCNWGFSCCGTTRFVFPRGEKQRVASSTKFWWDLFLHAHILINISYNTVITNKNKQTNLRKM